MQIDRLAVRNFRSLKDVTLNCAELTALVGRNGTGKSSFLRALELFYAASPKFEKEDFYDEDTAEPIEITLTFSNLSDEEFALFSKYVAESTLIVTKSLALSGDRPIVTVHGLTLQCADFRDVRVAPLVADMKARYRELATTEAYQQLPPPGTKAAMIEALDLWETNHPESCVRLRDDGRFFGLNAVAAGYLAAHTRFISIPAVRDAAGEATESRSSAITQLMDVVVRSKLESRDDIAALKLAAEERYREIMAPGNLPEITGLARDLTATLNEYVADAAIEIEWSTPETVEIPMPRAQLRLVEDGYSSTVERTGHGLQRAFILTLLQHLVATEDTNDHVDEVTLDEPSGPSPELEVAVPQADVPGPPDVILAIEEPELYQHPNRQRHLARVLLALARKRGPTGSRTQVLYVTHSPLFVGLDRFNLVRVLRKRDAGAVRPKETVVSEASADVVAAELWALQGAQGAAFSGDSLMPRLQSLMTPWMNEGFFADLVVLVEGEADRAAILGTAAGLGHDFDALGIAVIPCGGKKSLDRPFLIFRSLGIPVYLVWDSDRGQQRPEENRYMLRLVGAAEADWTNAMEDSFAAFEENLGSTVEHELGGGFASIVDEVQKELGIPRRDQALKNPAVVEQVVRRARERALASPSMERLVQKIVGAVS